MRTGLRRLRYFKILNAHLNFRRAAEELGITQPALSRAIIQLESELGFPLFDRNNRNVALTEAGKVFLTGCQDALAMLDECEARARKTAHGEAGHLVIGYTEIAIAGKLARIVESFRKRYPDVEVEFRAAWTEAQYEMLASGLIDVGFLTGPITQTELASLCIQTDPLVVILPTAHPLAARDAVPLSALAGEPFVTGSEDRWRVFHRHLYRMCSEAGFRPNVVQTAPDTLSIFGLVACGMGITVQTDYPQSRNDDRVAVRPLAGKFDRIQTYAAWNADGANMAGRAFASHLEAWRAS